MWTNRWMDRQTDEKRTNEQTEFHQFRKEPSYDGDLYLPVKFEFNWSNRFGVRVWKRKCGQTDRWTDKRTKNGQTNRPNFTNFERNLAMMLIYVPVKFEFDWTNHFQVRVRKRKMWTDRRTSDTSI